jgi:signal transduction histidine kinase
MQTLRRHPLAKAGAILLLTLSMFAALITGGITVALYSCGALDSNPAFAQQAAQDLKKQLWNLGIGSKLSQFIKYLPSGEDADQEDFEAYLREVSEGTSLRWELTLESSGRVILGNMEECRQELGEDCAALSYVRPYSIPIRDMLVMSGSAPSTAGGWVYTYLTAYVVPGLGANDYFAWVDSAVDSWAAAGWWLAAVCALFLLLSAALLGFLIWAAGWKRGAEGPVLRRWDRVPLELCAGTAAILVYVLLSRVLQSIRNFFYYNSQAAYLVWGTLFAVLAGLVLLFLLLSLCTRLKVKDPPWWKTVLTARLLRWAFLYLRDFLRWCRETAAMIPGIWRYVLALTGLGLLELLLFLLPFLTWDFGWLLLFPLVNLFVLAAFVRMGWDLRLLLRAGQHLAEGDLTHQVDTKKLHWVFRTHGEHLNAIGQGMSRALEKELRSERMRTELITNVSHDIKTPLTSIVNYVDLLQKPHDDAQEKEYLEVLSRQSARLKRLTEDLVEASKASAGAMEVHLERRDLTELLRQALGEYTERLAAARVEPVLQLPAGPLWADVDGRLLWRAMDNLLSNAAKYALPGTRLYCQADREDGEAVICFKNISREPLDVAPEELMERFVRGDASRSTEGSGLGLNIAQSLAKLQGGRLELYTDGDLFKAELRFPLKPCAWGSAVVE